ncbi:hypothetical protein HKX54_19760 [Sulfitobacter sp. M57]|uniref:hypothetical protein n=1 Tax=unclassified Sulfitobacter TaxID=196795 RepID=UPI0023E12754|nr:MULTISPECIES: hypothetical protein [unclassified Sulfitobacter]MDF3416713.1 hypothetical protein [Sulfitobacter sp. KE5]MDF3424203.1 hypothetical protein [Sulfitobacter sp. KE43]MDF3435284.1 hypothetical protein [Sulfitobacter sp. KE42]MDF3460897.1 hypothetical protein [Sulfitobacter sp. S74]MDF3464804.1 hypothetical protein [Sulfitobacter sp. Ks18]
MTDQSITFSDLITDKDGNASKVAFVRLANELIEEGRRPDRVFRAMLRAAYAASIQHSFAECYSFVRHAADDITDLKDQLEKMADLDLEEQQRLAQNMGWAKFYGD